MDRQETTQEQVTTIDQSSISIKEIFRKNAAHKPWTNKTKILFRIAFVFFVLMCIPNSLDWYKHVLNIDWTQLHYRDLYDIARFGSGITIFGNSILGNQLAGYASWIITFGIAIVVGAAWTLLSKRNGEPEEYNRLYYWVRALVRYRAGIGIIGFGFTKLLPVQMPYPGFGLLNTDFGDFTAQKIYWLSVGIVPWYQIFAGVVEVLAGTLLFFRGTTFWGAALLFGALGDIVYVNFAYDGGVHVYSSYFVLLSAFLLLQDIPKLYNLLINERITLSNNFYPTFEGWWQYVRIGLKSATIFIFLILLFYLQYINFLYDPYKQPSTAGVKKLRGNYEVTEFRVNHKIIPFSPLDSIRWQEASFEKWSTLTFKVNKPTPLDLSNGGGDPMRDVNRTFELTGVAGGRRVFHYYADTVNHLLYLQDKYKDFSDGRNRLEALPEAGNKKVGQHVQKEEQDWIPQEAWKNIGNEVDFIHPKARSARRTREFASASKNEKRKRMILHYSTEDGSKVFLKGIDEHKDSIHVLLTKFERRYAISPGNLEAGQY